MLSEGPTRRSNCDHRHVQPPPSQQTLVVTWEAVLGRSGRLALSTLLVAVAACVAQPIPTSLTPQASATLIAPTALPSRPSPSPDAWLTLGPNATDAAWSPDGRHLLVWRNGANTTADPADLWIDLPDGTNLQVFDGIGGRGAGFAGAGWIDNTRFVAGDNGRNVLGTIGSTVLRPFMALVDVETPISNGRGVLAYRTNATYGGGEHYAVWTSAGSTKPLAGSPVAWSHDGSELVVWHWTSGTGPGSNGWVEIVAWPGLRRIAAWTTENVGLPDPGSLIFDPSDRYFFSAGRVHDLATGTISTIPLGVTSGEVAWTSSPEIVAADFETLRARGYDVTGHQMFETDAVGDSVTASADGSTLVFWSQHGTRLTILRDGDERHIDAPIDVAVLISPDGTGFVLPQEFEPLLLRP